ncbi:chloride channel protein [Reinekea thalattae]|uniref:Chloride channel protein n=1 Tax=Reinekea thalattae TaxID=2593301 RepID=A0A5C8ZC79_9GAMM|nr:chloride channel protein [Reinekea thalattae]TXR54899.1 chloride channel protein [Reinekea thalattae]
MTQPTLKRWQSKLLHSNSLALLSCFGILIGISTSLVIALFMVSIELVLSLLNDSHQAGFGSLAPLARASLPIAGAIILILLYRNTNSRYHDVGITHVIDRLQIGRGKIPLGNTLFQLVSAQIALASGFSMGKEGPAVHVGSGIASKLGRMMHRSPSQLRLLTGCGTAAAISAAFDTPLAGVMFAMEVVLMEYSLMGFIPIIAASVTAAVVTDFLIGGRSGLFAVDIVPAGLTETPFLLVTGIATGLVAAALHRLIKRLAAIDLVSRDSKLIIAGIMTGLLGMLVPQMMGLGYGVMESILNGEFALWYLIAILAAKLLATGIAVGLGVPAGIVAPSLVIGMATGAIAGAILPGSGSDSFYALIGMAGVMSALLHAPLAALTAVLELSLNAEMMFHTMVVVVLANLTCQAIFLQPSIFQTMLSLKGLQISTHPVRNALASRFLSEIAITKFVVIHDQMDTESIEQMLHVKKRLVIYRYAAESYLIPHKALKKQYEKWLHLDPDDDVNLYQYLSKVIPARSRISVLQQDASLLEGIKTLQNDDVVAIQVPIDAFRIGLVTRAKLSTELTSESELN